MVLGVVLLSAVGATGCSSTELDPFDNQDRFFTVWGFLDVEESVQRIRVVPIRREPEDIANSNGQQVLIDAQVTTTELGTGRVTRWQPRLVRVGEEGTLVRVFEAGFTPLEGEAYRLEVTRSDGEQVVAQVTVPDYRTDNEPIFGALTGEGEALAQEVRIVGGPPQAQPIVDYWIQDYRGLQSVKIPYEGVYDAATETWQFTMQPGLDVPKILRQIDYDPSLEESVSLDRYHIKLRIPDAEWLQPEDVPRGAEGQPGVFDNIENGYGYFGMVGWYRYTVNPAGALGDRMPLPRF
ncbi:MAG: hypothetical protein RhofKO_28850 [Rhodothermales bacterium]